MTKPMKVSVDSAAFWSLVAMAAKDLSETATNPTYHKRGIQDLPVERMRQISNALKALESGTAFLNANNLDFLKPGEE